MIYYRQEKKHLYQTSNEQSSSNLLRVLLLGNTFGEDSFIILCFFYITTKLNTYGKYILRMKFIRYYLLYIKNNNYIKIIKLIFIEWSLLLAVFQQNYIIEHQKNIFSSLIFRIKIHWGYQLLSASIHCCATLINI